MKTGLLLFLALTTVSCGIFLGENPRSLTCKMKSGEVLRFSLSENRFPLTERRTLIVKLGSYSLKGRDCEDPELKRFSNEAWTEIAKSAEPAGIKSATMMLEKETIQGTPKYCYFRYSKKNNGEWIQD